MLESIRTMDGNRRFVALGIAITLLVGALLLGRSATRTEYLSLYQGLDLSESGKVTAALEKGGVPYRLGTGGTEVLVPEPDAARARVLLAQDGLPQSGRPGLELFDKPAWGMTDFTQHITYRRALEGELARTIGMLRGVERAQVHLALSEASPLRRMERSAEAAVVLVLERGYAVTPEQVQGIARLVSSSVERLPVERVAVLDDSGRLLSSGAAGEMALSAQQMDMQSKVENYLLQKIEPLMTAAAGPGAARVQVNARLNFDQLERTVEQYDTAGKVLQNEQRSENAGAVGVDGYADTPGATILNNTYLNSRRMERLVAGSGNIERLSVSVMLDERVFTGDRELTAERRAQLAELVRGAVGIDTTRGDVVSVIAMPFEGQALSGTIAVAEEAEAKTSALDLAKTFALPVAALLIAVLAAALGWRALRPTRVTALATQPGQQPRNWEGGEEHRTDLSGMPTVEGQDAVLKARVATESLSAPESAARVLRAWLVEAS